MQNVKTVGLLALLSALLVFAAQAFGASAWVGLGFAAVLNLGAYFFSDKIALASSRARPVTEEQLPGVYVSVRRLTTAANMPMPSIHVIDSPQPNAFATGRSPKHAAVAVTTGILQILTLEELDAVLGHELSHVRNRDILISSIAAMLAAALSMLARFAFFFGGGGDSRNNPIGAIGVILSIVVAPLAAMLIRLAISRAREFEADADGAALTGRPLELASALAKIARGAAQKPMDVNPAFAQLYIANPLKESRRKNLMNLLSTHPPMEERIKRLQAISARS
ncbi:MAG: M48 family metalloprotease [Acidimicrobiia bacterium]|nr:M48 family metalloprotease [Acidimicrobiia bacterium]